MKTIRLRIRNQNKYYHNRGRADGLSGWPQNYEVNFRGCGTPYQTQGKKLIQMCCNLANCLPPGDAYNNNQEFQEVNEIVVTTQHDWPLSDCREHKRSKVQGRRPRWSDPVEVGVLYIPLPMGRIPLPSRMNFWKNSKRPLAPPPLIFGKLCCKFSLMDMVAFMQGGIGQIVSVNN